MVSPKLPFLNDADIAGIHDAMGQGFATVEALQDPPPIVTFQRRNPSTGKPVVVLPDVQLIRIGFPERDETVVVTGGTVSRNVPGELRGWAPLPIQRDDLFEWQGQRCKIVTVYPERFGTVRATFEVVQ